MIDWSLLQCMAQHFCGVSHSSFWTPKTFVYTAYQNSSSNWMSTFHVFAGSTIYLPDCTMFQGMASGCWEFRAQRNLSETFFYAEENLYGTGIETGPLPCYLEYLGCRCYPMISLLNLIQGRYFHTECKWPVPWRRHWVQSAMGDNAVVCIQ